MSEITQPKRAELPAHLAEYRKHLVSAEQKSQEDFDKTVLSLSGGALGISFVFLKDVVGANPVQGPGWLLISWIAWGISSLCVLASYFMSHLALRVAISQVDNGTIYSSPVGGAFRRWTSILNASGAILFLTGVFAITIFAGMNLLNKGVNNATVTTNPSASASVASTASGAATSGREKPAASNARVHPSGSAPGANTLTK